MSLPGEAEECASRQTRGASGLDEISNLESMARQLQISLQIVRGAAPALYQPEILALT
jgi:hypothetical protein